MPVYSSKETRKAQAIRDHDLEYQNEIKARLYQLEGKHRQLNARNNKLKKDRSVQQGQNEEEKEREIANGINYAKTVVEPIMLKQAEKFRIKLESLKGRKKRQREKKMRN